MADPSSSFPTLRLPPERCREWIISLHEFLALHRVLCDAHTVDFFTKDHWQKKVKDDWKDVLRQLNDTDLMVNPPSEQQPVVEGSLLEFLQTARRLRLPMEAVDTGKDRLLFGMTPKKSHEVNRTSDFIATCCLPSRGIKQVLDLGSGKGYLSQHLSLQHGLTVVGMDSQSINTHGALRRNEKVCKAWKSSMKETTDSMNAAPKQREQQKTQALTASTTWEDKDLSLNALFDQDIHTQDDIAETADPNELSISMNTESLSREQPEVCSSTAAVSVVVLSRERQSLRLKANVPSYFPITREVGLQAGRDILQEAELESAGVFAASEPCCLVGLHTCGDLAANCLHLYTQLQSVKLVCVVGCCYHLISERPDEEGFPMSSYLKSLGGGLGRTARMLACQTISKIATITRGNALEIGMYRAVFQVLLMRMEVINSDESSVQFVVGKQRHMPHSFEEYARRAAVKLGVDISSISDQDLRDLYAEYAGRAYELEKFLQLRAVLAPCIESLIVLDRLLYLWEQETTKDCFLVQLFDALLSPRCFGIIASKVYNN